MNKNTYIRSTIKEITLGNVNMEMRICRKTGRILKLIHLRKSFDWNTHLGNLEIYDGLADKHFTGSESPAKTTFKIIKRGVPSVTIRRRFHGASFWVNETFQAEKECIHWDVELLLDDDKQERNIEIRQLVPYPTAPWGWKAWSANFNYPTNVHNVAGTHLEYGDICFGTVIPAITLYHPGNDVGLAIAKPFGQLNPRLRFYFTDYTSEGIYVENDLLGLRHGKPIKSTVMLRFHEGCFRPTLAWLLKRYPEYFLPGNPDVSEFEGSSMFGPPHVSKGDADKMAKVGIKWYEIHHSMPYYGQYCPDEKEWFDGSDPTKMDYGKPITRKIINNCGKTLAKHGIATLLYLQVTGDAYLPRWPKKWKSSLARNMNGNLFPVVTAMVNSDPLLPFGKEMQRQIKGVLERYPDITGIFLDQACYNVTDCAHDDGITMYKNKPAYRLRYNFDRHLPELVEELHKRRKIIYANGTYDIELGKGFDGNMAESTSRSADTMKYMHIAKPLLFFGYSKDEDDTEYMLQKCLLAGSSWSYWVKTKEGWFVKKDATTQQRKVYDRYLPLCRKLLGRRILLEANPLKFLSGSNFLGPDEAREITMGEGESTAITGEIFIGKTGDILISLVTRRKKCLDDSKFTKNLRIVVRTKLAKTVCRAYVLGVDYTGTKPVKMRCLNKNIVLTLPVHGAASLVVLETKKKR